MPLFNKKELTPEEQAEVDRAERASRIRSGRGSFRPSLGSATPARSARALVPTGTVTL
jgi:hypothetical protein